MKNFKRLVKYEAVRIWTQKWWLLLLLGIIIVFAIVFAADYYDEGRGYKLPEMSPIDREHLLQSSIESYERTAQLLEEYGDTMTDAQFEYYRKEMAFDRFFIETGTIRNDYIDKTQYKSKYTGYEAAGFCSYYFELMTFVFCASAVVCALWTFSAERRTVKNVLAAPIKRKEIFAVKTGITFTAAMSLPTLLYIVLLIVCACSPQMPFLMYSNGRCYALSVTAMFAQLGLRNLLVIACFYSLTLLGTQYLKPLASALTPLFTFAFCELLAGIIANKPILDKLSSASFDTFNLFPVLGLWNYLGGFDLHFILLFVIHLIGVCGVLLWSGLKFNKKDF